MIWNIYIVANLPATGHDNRQKFRGNFENHDIFYKKKASLNVNKFLPYLPIILIFIFLPGCS